MRYISIFACLILLAIICCFSEGTNLPNSEYLRIHIRANSNSVIDQNIKYEIKDAVVDSLIPLLANCTTKKDAYSTLSQNLTLIENIADDILKTNNFNYTSSAKLAHEEFPTRNYQDLTLENGFYDALILELGTASGDNWWCVVYPPLCFVNGSTKVTQFKSRIIEIINNFFN